MTARNDSSARLSDIHSPVKSPLVASLPAFISEHGKRLEEAGIAAGKAEVEIILCHLLDCDRLQLYLHGTTLIHQEHLEKFEEILRQRLTRYPLQYILKEAWFYGRKFFVSPSVMVPTPETEILCEAALRFVRKAELAHARILDVGVGSGVIAVTMARELKEVSVVALDVSEDAIAVAKQNAEVLGASAKIEFRRSNFFSAVDRSEQFDLILSNPPYISESEYVLLPPEVLADPKISLTAGQEGLDAIEVILREAPNYLAPGGRIFFEIGYNQADQVAALTESDARYSSIAILRDLNEIDRVVILSCDTH